MAAVKACLLSALAGAAAGWQCGVGHHEMGHQLEVQPLIQPQVYETHDMVDRYRRLSNLADSEPELARRLQTQAYADSPAFIPLRVVHANGDSRPIRITILWDVVNGNDDDYLEDAGGGNYVRTSSRRMCTSTSDTVSAKGPSGWRNTQCTDKMIATAGSARYAAMVARTNAAAEYWRKGLRLKPVQDAITVPVAPDNPITVNFGIAPNTTYTNTDLVLIMTARPSPESPIAGFAICYQKDQRGRCTIGHFNWVPEVLNVANTDSADTIESEMHTALHEIMHVLGGMGPGIDASASVFLDDSGQPKAGSDVFLVEEDPAYKTEVAAAIAAGAPITTSKMRTLITTPKVVEVTRKWTGCATAAGFPLEDVPLGKGSHWEARVAGPELMSYGSGSGQVYISDLTLAFLEDTGQYIPDYTVLGGPIIPSRNALADDVAAGLVSYSEDNTGNPDYTPPTPMPPGAMRWGIGQGCAFFEGNPSKVWPSVPGYTCDKNQYYTCTPDGRMSAVCIVKSDWTSVPSNPSCGRYNQLVPGVNDNDPDFGPICDVENGASTAGQIPPYMRWFATDAAAATAAGRTTASAGSTGGYNDAMDYAPVPVGYWNCMYPKPTDNATAGAAGEYGATLGQLASYFGVAADMDNFGGQARCPQCRCFMSSLIEVTKSATLNPAFPQYGLCYRSNCYRPDYLQVGVKGVLNGGKSQWFKCPTDGGKMYIPGFAGALHCPRASDFCAHENITGVKYPETDIVTEAIFWGVLLAGILFAGLFLSCPCLRNRVLNCSKRCCGARVFEDEITRKARQSAKSKDAAEVDLPDPTPLPKCASTTLFGVNIFTLLIALAIIGLTSYSIYLAKVYSFGMSMLGLGLLILILSGMGICSSRARAEYGPSCWVLSYFFLDLLLLVLLVWGVAWNLAFASYDSYVDRYYDVIVDAVPASMISNRTRTEGVQVAASYIKGNMAAVAGLGVAVLAVFFINLAAAGRIITGKVLVSIALTFFNHVLMAFGLLSTVVGWYLFQFRDNAGGNPEVVYLTVAAGMLLLVISVLGHVGVFYKRVDVMIAYILFSSVLLALYAVVTWACFSRAQAIADWIAGQDDKKLGSIASSLGLALTKQTIIEQLQSNLHQLGLAFGVVLLLQLCLVINCGLFIRGVKRWNADHGRNIWGKEVEGVAAGGGGAAGKGGDARLHPVSPAGTRGGSKPLSSTAPTTGGPVVARPPIIIMQDNPQVPANRQGQGQGRPAAGGAQAHSPIGRMGVARAGAVPVQLPPAGSAAAYGYSAQAGRAPQPPAGAKGPISPPRILGGR